MVQPDDRLELVARRLGVAHQVILRFLPGGRLDGLDGPGAQRELVVGDDEAVVHADHAAEATAGLAGAERGVEREQARRRVAVVNVAVRAVQVRGVAPHAALAALPDLHVDAAATHAQRGLDGLEYAAAARAGCAEAVLHHVEAVGRARVDARVALLREERQHLGLGEIRRHEIDRQHRTDPVLK